MYAMSTNPLRAYRANNRLTLKSVADAFGVHKTTVLRWEEGQIPAERVASIAAFTGLQRADLRPDLYCDHSTPIPVPAQVT